jgi:hypothetical protein
MEPFDRPKLRAAMQGSVVQTAPLPGSRKSTCVVLRLYRSHRHIGNIDGSAASARIDGLALRLMFSNTDSRAFMSDSATNHQPGLDARVLVKIGLALIACLAAVLGVVVAAIYAQIGNVKVEVGSVRTGLSAINARLGLIEKTVDETRAKLDQLVRDEKPTGSLPQTDSLPQTGSLTQNVVAGFYVTEQEAEFIREFLKVPPRKANVTAKMALWVRVPAQATKPLPDALVGRLEKLKGLRYAVDANSAIALIEPSTSIVIALI